MTLRVMFFGLVLTFLIAGCSKNNTPGTSDACNTLGFSGAANAGFSPAGVFSASPITPAAVSSIIPLGNLNPPGHVYPTDHMYLVLQSTSADTNPVYAAAAGTVINLYQPSGTDSKLVVKVDSSFYYYYDHIHAANGVGIGSQLTAGQQVGMNSGLAAAVDFGVYNFNHAPLAGILDACLAESQASVDSPLKYYSGTLQTTLYGKVTVSGGQTQDGKIDYDQSGKLVGDWALSGHQAAEGGSVQLAFVYNVLSLALRVSVGGTLAGGAATYGVQGGAPDFNAITVASGQVNYQLFPTSNGDSTAPGLQYGVLSVQMLSSTQIKVEIFQGAVASGTFDGSAQIYNR